MDNCIHNGKRYDGMVDHKVNNDPKIQYYCNKVKYNLGIYWQKQKTR